MWSSDHADAKMTKMIYLCNKLSRALAFEQEKGNLS